MLLYWINRQIIGNHSKKKVRIAGASEPAYSDFPFLKTIEWGGMVCLQEEKNSEEIAILLNIPYLHSPISDYNAPTEAILERVIEFYQECLNENPQYPILVHCTAGFGRTGTILASLLVILDQISPNNAINKVRKVNPLAIETKEQEEFIMNLNFPHNS